MKRNLGAACSFSLVAAISTLGCYDPPASSERLEESIVITTHDEAAEFGSFRTFFLRPEVRVLDEENVESGEPEFLPANLAAPLISATRENLIARGFTEAVLRDDAHLGIEIVYARAVFSDYYCYYWGDWAYWGYPGWSYYYPYGCTGSAWQSGMVITHAIDLSDAGAQLSSGKTEGLVRGLWYSGVYGVETTAEVVVDRAVDGINQAFEQSPYLSATAR